MAWTDEHQKLLERYMRQIEAAENAIEEILTDNLTSASNPAVGSVNRPFLERLQKQVEVINAKIQRLRIEAAGGDSYFGGTLTYNGKG